MSNIRPIPSAPAIIKSVLAAAAAQDRARTIEQARAKQ